MDMFNYTLKRILQMIPVFIIVAVLVFVLIRLIPGDPAKVMLGERATETSLAAMRAKLGLDKSYVTQFLIYAKQLIHFDLGDSIKYNMPVSKLLGQKLMVTLSLTLVSTLFTIILSFAPGYIAGIFKDKLPDTIIRVIALVALSVPTFWIGLMLLTIFAVHWKFFPVSGWGTGILEHIRGLILPGITQAICVSAIMVRNLRNNVVDIRHSDYVDFARSKGISPLRVSTAHIIRNALIPTTTLLALRIASMLGGSIVVESVFTLPGLGALLVNAIYARDYPVVQGVVLLFVVLVMVINLATDIIYSLIDPRVKLS